jgi:hypothetical protein
VRGEMFGLLNVPIPPGKSLARPETGVAFLATRADSWRQRPRYPASPAGKPRKVKDYSDRRQESEVSQDCVVELTGLEPATKRLCGLADRCLDVSRQHANPSICC